MSFTSLSRLFALDVYNIKLKLDVVKPFVKIFRYFIKFLIDFNTKNIYIAVMNIKEYIKLCCVKRNISNAELARLTEQSPQSFNQKMQRNSFQSAELEKIAAALDADLDIRFIDHATAQPII